MTILAERQLLYSAIPVSVPHFSHLGRVPKIHQTVVSQIADKDTVLGLDGTTFTQFNDNADLVKIIFPISFLQGLRAGFREASFLTCLQFCS